MKKVYISGPITYATGPDQFGPLKARLEAMGYQTLNPKEVPACAERSCQRLPHEIEKGFEHSWACFLKHDLVAMLQECDTIVMMDGWQDSHGARLELSTAAAVGMNVLFARDLVGGASIWNTPIPTPVPYEPAEIHITDVSKHGGHWDVSCAEPRCQWTAVNITNRARADELASEHEARDA